MAEADVSILIHQATALPLSQDECAAVQEAGHGVEYVRPVP